MGWLSFVAVQAENLCIYFSHLGVFHIVDPDVGAPARCVAAAGGDIPETERALLPELVVSEHERSEEGSVVVGEEIQERFPCGEKPSIGISYRLHCPPRLLFLKWFRWGWGTSLGGFRGFLGRKFLPIS